MKPLAAANLHPNFQGAARAPLAIDGDRDVGPRVRRTLLSPESRSGAPSTLEEPLFDYRIWRLRREHRDLEAQVTAELRRPNPNEAIIRSLKRRKLRLRDELFIAETGLVPVRASRR